MFSNIFAQYVPGTLTTNATKTPDPDETDSDVIYEDFPSSRPANRTSIEILKPVKEETDQRRPWRSRNSSTELFDVKMKRRASVESAAASSINSGCLLEHDLYSKKRKQQTLRDPQPSHEKWELDHREASTGISNGPFVLDITQGPLGNTKFEDEIEMARKALDEAYYENSFDERSHNQEDRYHHSRRKESRRHHDRFEQTNYDSIRSFSESDQLESFSRHERHQKSPHRHGGHSARQSSRQTSPYTSPGRAMKFLSQQHVGELPTESPGLERRRSLKSLESWGSDSSSSEGYLDPLQNGALSPGQKTNSSVGDSHSFDGNVPEAGRSQSPSGNVSFAPTESTTEGPTNTSTSDADDQKSILMPELALAPLQVSIVAGSSFDSCDDFSTASDLLVDFPNKESCSDFQNIGVTESIISKAQVCESHDVEKTNEKVDALSVAQEIHDRGDELKRKEEGHGVSVGKFQEGVGKMLYLKEHNLGDPSDDTEEKQVEPTFEGSDCSNRSRTLNQASSRNTCPETEEHNKLEAFRTDNLDGTAISDEILIDDTVTNNVEATDQQHHDDLVFVPSRDDKRGETKALRSKGKDEDQSGTDHALLVPLKDIDAFPDLPMEDFNGQESFMESIVIENDDFEYFQASDSFDDDQRESNRKIVVQGDGSVRSLPQSLFQPDKPIGFERNMSTSKRSLSQSSLLSKQSKKSVGQQSVQSVSSEAVEGRKRRDSSHYNGAPANLMTINPAIDAVNRIDAEPKPALGERRRGNEAHRRRSRPRSKSRERKSCSRSKSRRRHHESKKRHGHKSSHRSRGKDKSMVLDYHGQNDKESPEARPRKERDRSESRDRRPHRNHSRDRHRSRDQDRHRSRDHRKSTDRHNHKSRDRDRRSSGERQREEGEGGRHRPRNDEHHRDFERRRHRSRERKKGRDPSTKLSEDVISEQRKRQHLELNLDEEPRRTKDPRGEVKRVQISGHNNVAIKQTVSSSQAGLSDTSSVPRNFVQGQNDGDGRFGKRLQTGRPGMRGMNQKSVSRRMGRKSFSILAYSWTSEQTITGNPLYNVEADDSAISRVRQVRPVVANETEQRQRKGLLGKMAKVATWFQRFNKRKGENVA